jgi:hypothetical protein
MLFVASVLLAPCEYRSDLVPLATQVAQKPLCLPGRLDPDLHRPGVPQWVPTMDEHYRHVAFRRSLSPNVDPEHDEHVGQQRAMLHLRVNFITIC